MSKRLPNATPSLHKPSLKVLLIAYLPPIAWAALIFFLSAQQTLPGPSVTVLDYLFKKSAHIFVYFVLAWLVQRALNLTTAHKPKMVGVATFILCLAYAVSDEFHQSFTPGRFASAYDVGYDMVGTSLSIMLRSKLLKLHR